MQSEVLLGSLLEVKADAIVNPANSYGYMGGGGGVAGVIKRAGGGRNREGSHRKGTHTCRLCCNYYGWKTSFQRCDTCTHHGRTSYGNHGRKGEEGGEGLPTSGR